MLIRLLSNKILPLDINRENGIDVGTRHFGQGAEMLDAGVTDDDIETAEFFHQGLEHRWYFGLA